MKLLQEYERRAEECRKLAERAEGDHRKAILSICEIWKKLARERRALLERQEIK